MVLPIKGLKIANGSTWVWTSFSKRGDRSSSTCCDRTPSNSAPETTDASAKQNDDSKTYDSPMVGTFYRRPSPEDPEFVKIGDKVKKGDVLCIIEAMKVMNEIQADFTGDIVEAMVEDGVSVEFGQPLFKIRPA